MSGNPALYRHALPRGRLLTDRNRELVRIATGRTVAHVGCTDSPITDAQIESGDLLHLQLGARARAILGVDIDAEGIDLLQKLAPGPYAATDITLDASAIVDFRPEVIVASDVVEHVPDVGAFLRALVGAARAITPAPEVVVTTPNLLGIRNVWHTAAGVEVVHEDHCLGFTPHTLRKLLRQSGFSGVRCDYYVIRTGTSPARRMYDGAASIAARLRHAYADGLFMTCDVR